MYSIKINSALWVAFKIVDRSGPHFNISIIDILTVGAMH